MPEATYARGELALLSFATAWATHCEERGLAWPAPKIAVEDGVAIARFSEQRVSVRAAEDADRTQPEFAWCTDEAEARWVPVVWLAQHASVFCHRLAAVLVRRIPW